MSWLTDRYIDGGAGINNLDWSNIAKDLGVAGAVYSLINPNDSSGIAKFLGTGGRQQPIGYTGGIPNYTATRDLAPNAFAQTYTTPTGEIAPRRPGSVGRKYFTDTTFTQDTGTPFMGITAEQIAAQNQAALDEQALFESILGGVEAQRIAGGTGGTTGTTGGTATGIANYTFPTEIQRGVGMIGVGDSLEQIGYSNPKYYFQMGLTPEDIINRGLGGFTSEQPGSKPYDLLVGEYKNYLEVQEAHRQGDEYARRIMQEPGEYAFNVTDDANYFRPDVTFGLFDQGLTPEQLMQPGGAFEYVYPGSAGESGLRQAYQYWQQNRAGTGGTTDTTDTTDTGGTPPGTVYDESGVYTPEGYRVIPYNNFVNQFMGRDLTADDAKTLARSPYSLDALAKSFGVSTADLQNFVNYYTTGTTDTTGIDGSRQLTAAELKQAVLDGTMDYSTAYRQLGIADAVNPFGFTEEEQMALGIHESQRTGQGYKYNPTTGSMDLYDYDTDAFVDRTVTGGTTDTTTATVADGPQLADLSTLGTSGRLTEDEQALIAQEIVENRTGITDVAELFDVPQEEVIARLLRREDLTPAQIAARYENVSEADLMGILLEQNLTTPAEVAAYYDIPESEVRAYARSNYGLDLAGGGYLGYAQGGNVNGYYLGGSTDGMADQIPATINNMQPAALSDGEFVIPADVVSHLGNGNSDAGAQNLYSMMERVRRDRTGNPKQGKQIDPNKYLA